MTKERAIPPPDDLNRAGKWLWRATQRHLRRQGTFEDTDAPLLEAYVRAVMLARSARAAAGAEPFVAGSRGQLVPHPGLKVAAEAERDARAAAGALLLTPEARKKNDLMASNERDPLESLLA